MTIPEALRVLDLSPPITRHQLSQAYQQAQVVWCVGRFEGNLDLIAKARARNAEIKAANALLSGLPDHAHPFQGGTAQHPEPPAPASPRRGVPKMAIMGQQQIPAQAKPPAKEEPKASPKAARGTLELTASEQLARSSRVELGIWALLALAAAIVAWVVNSPRTSKYEDSYASTPPAPPRAATPAPAPAPAPATPVPAKPDTPKLAPTLSMQELRQRAEQGDQAAMFELGNRYADGTQGVDKDKTAAVVWWRKAAEKGHREAQYRAGFAYRRGEGVVEDEAESQKWMRKAAEQGHPEAQYLVGLDYYLGQHGLPAEPATASSWLLKAAEQRQDKAQCLMGLMYKEGNGVEKDEAKALEWLKKAAAQDNSLAEYELGLCYARGALGTTKDLPSAVEWLAKAAEQGEISAQRELGALYQTGGPGVEPSFQEALVWYLIASKVDKNITAKIESVKEELTLTEVAEAEQYASTFIPRVQQRTRL